MKKRRRLRKPIRMALRFTGYAATAAATDLALISTHLYWVGDMKWMPAVGTCLLVNVVLQYLFFRSEMCAEK